MRDYRPEAGPFQSFVGLCIERNVVTAVKAATRQKHRHLNEADRLERPLPGEDGEGYSLGEVLAAAELAPPDQIAVRDQLRDALSRFDRLTPLEHVAFVAAQLDSYSYEEIAADQGVPVKTIDNAIQRATKKLQADRPPRSHPAQRRTKRRRKEPQAMSILHAIDAELEEARRELRKAEEWVGGLEQLREQAVSLDRSRVPSGPPKPTPSKPPARRKRRAVKPSGQGAVHHNTQKAIERRDQVVLFVAGNPGCSSQEIAEHLGVARDTARSLVSGLVRAGQISAQGATKNRRYFPPGSDSSPSSEALKSEPGSNGRLTFDEIEKLVLNAVSDSAGSLSAITTATGLREKQARDALADMVRRRVLRCEEGSGGMIYGRPGDPVFEAVS